MRVGLMSRTGNKMRSLSAPAAIMARMDTTQTERLLTDLAAADPADAPDLADEIADELAARLEAPPAEEPA